MQNFSKLTKTESWPAHLASSFESEIIVSMIGRQGTQDEKFYHLFLLSSADTRNTGQHRADRDLPKNEEIDPGPPDGSANRHGSPDGFIGGIAVYCTSERFRSAKAWHLPRSGKQFAPDATTTSPGSTLE